MRTPNTGQRMVNPPSTGNATPVTNAERSDAGTPSPSRRPPGAPSPERELLASGLRAVLRVGHLHDALGLGRARTDRIRPDTDRSTLVCDVLRQPDDAPLRGRVVCAGEEAHAEPGRRRDIHDAAATFEFVVGGCRALLDATEIHVKHLVPGRCVDLLVRLGVDDRGVVHEHIEATERVDRVP